MSSDVGAVGKFAFSHRQLVGQVWPVELSELSEVPRVVRRRLLELIGESFNERVNFELVEAK